MVGVLVGVAVSIGVSVAVGVPVAVAVGGVPVTVGVALRKGQAPFQCSTSGRGELEVHPLKKPTAQTSVAPSAATA